MVLKKNVLETSEVLQEVLSDFEEDGFTYAFRMSYGKAPVFFDVYWKQEKENATFCSAFNAFAQMKFIEQFLAEHEVILSDAVRFRLRDHYKGAALELAKNMQEKALTKFVSEDVLKKETNSRVESIMKDLGTDETVELLKTANLAIENMLKKHHKDTKE